MNVNEAITGEDPMDGMIYDRTTGTVKLWNREREEHVLFKAEHVVELADLIRKDIPVEEPPPPDGRAIRARLDSGRGGDPVLADRLARLTAAGILSIEEARATLELPDDPPSASKEQS